MPSTRSSRRSFLKSVVAGTAGLLGARNALARPRLPGRRDETLSEAPAAKGSALPERPNILWITAEDVSPDLGCYGDAYACTPNLDRLAREGTRFDRAFAHAGVCAPARSGIITGCYPTTLGTNPMRCRGIPPEGVKCFTEHLRAAGYFCTNNAKTDYQFPPPRSAWDECGGKAHWRHRPEGSPFFAVFNITTSHEGQIRSHKEGLLKKLATLTGDERHDPAGASLPPYYPDVPEARKDWARYADLVTLMDRQVGDLLEALEADGLADDTIVWFYGDHGRGLPRAKRWIYDSGLRVPLIVRVPEKYRDRAAGITDASPDASSRAPSIRIPGGADSRLVAFVDFAPTALSLAGVIVPEVMQGRPFLGTACMPPRTRIHAARDRMDEAFDLIRAVRDERFEYIRNFLPNRPRSQPIAYMDEMPTMRALRKLHAEGRLDAIQAIFFEDPKPLEELYDTRDDPHEVRNLAGDPAYREALLRMRAELRSWMIETGDVGLIPESMMDGFVRPGGAWPEAGSVAACYVDPSIPSRDPEDPNTPPPPRRISVRIVRLACPGTPGASIVWRERSVEGEEKRGEGPWRLYSAPIELPLGRRIEARACRAGFEEGPPLKFRVGDRPTPETMIDAGSGPKHWREELTGGRLERLVALKDRDFLSPERSMKAWIGDLDHENPEVRWWAVIGLEGVSLGKEDLERVRPLLHDAEPAVAVIAAESLTRRGLGDEALPVLAHLLDHEAERVRLEAAQALLRLGALARPALDAVRNHAKDKDKYVARTLGHVLEK